MAVSQLEMTLMKGREGTPECGSQSVGDDTNEW